MGGGGWGTCVARALVLTVSEGAGEVRGQEGARWEVGGAGWDAGTRAAGPRPRCPQEGEELRLVGEGRGAPHIAHQRGKSFRLLHFARTPERLRCWAFGGALAVAQVGAHTPNFNRMAGNPVCRQIDWQENPEHLAAWREGRTGFPWIDAIMVQLRTWVRALGGGEEEDAREGGKGGGGGRRRAVARRARGEICARVPRPLIELFSNVRGNTPRRRRRRVAKQPSHRRRRPLAAAHALMSAAMMPRVLGKRCRASLARALHPP